MNLNITGDEIDLNKEICRLETFKNNFIEDGELLAMYGIYCLDEEKFFLTNERYCLFL